MYLNLVSESNIFLKNDKLLTMVPDLYPKKAMTMENLAQAIPKL